MFVKTTLLSLVIATSRASIPLVPEGCESFPCKHDGGGLMYVTKRHFGKDAPECSCERYFSDPESPCYDQECLGKDELIVLQGDGTCACERPCDPTHWPNGKPCGDDAKWIPVVDYNRIGGTSYCSCADKDEYAKQLKATQKAEPHLDL